MHKENPSQDLSKIEKEAIGKAENEKRVMELAQLQRKQEDERLQAELRKQEELEKERLERERREQEKREEDRLQMLYEQRKKEELASKLFAEEKSNTLDRIRTEREKLKSELDELQNIKQETEAGKNIVGKKSKGIVIRFFEGVLFLAVFSGIGFSGYYLYTVYHRSSNFELAQNHINQQEWALAAGYLAKSIEEYDNGKLAVSSTDAASMRVWYSVAQKFSVWVPELRRKIYSVHSSAECNAINAKFRTVNWKQLSTAYLPRVDVYRAVNSVTLALDSMNLFALQTFLKDTGNIKLGNGSVVYADNTGKLTIDSLLTGMVNKEHGAVSVMYASVDSAQKQLLSVLQEKSRSGKEFTRMASQKVTRNLPRQQAMTDDDNANRTNKRNAD